MKSSVVKRSVVIAGHKTSVSLEDTFWKAFREIADQRNMTSSELAATISSERQNGNLSSAIRIFVLEFVRNQLSKEQAERGRTADPCMERRVRAQRHCRDALDHVHLDQRRLVLAVGIRDRADIKRGV